jgi:GNAT superfamily N-acetyltransferase
MPRLDVIPFGDEHLDPAARLLAERHRRHREAEPLLPESVDFRAEIETLRQAKGASGVVALEDGRVVGYLVARRRDEPRWEGTVWVEPAGHAVAEPEHVLDLYAAAAHGWVEGGATRHYALVPATDRELVDAWFRVGFGAQHALGIREVPPAAGTPPAAGIRIRRGLVEDAAAGEALSIALDRHQSLSPVFSPAAPQPDPAELREEWIEEAEDPNAALIVAERDGRLIGLITAAPVEYSSAHVGLARPPEAGILGYAATLPGERGSGVGLALTEAVFDWARKRGYRTIVVDWRTTNLLASRFWRARGFRTSFLRLYRSIP